MRKVCPSLKQKRSMQRKSRGEGLRRNGRGQKHEENGVVKAVDFTRTKENEKRKESAAYERKNNRAHS